MMISLEYLLDSFAWLEYFGGNERYRAYVESEVSLPLTASVSLTEVIRSLLRKGKSRRQVDAAVEFIASRSLIVPVDKLDAIRAGFLAEEKGLHFSDSLIYALAGSERRLVTGDSHFKGLENVEFVR
ncbi:MAG: PIN domain-containing protein [Candidatus Micrarchaeota archaeon]